MMKSALPPAEGDPVSASPARYAVTIRGLVLMCSIGIRRREREQKQRVRISVDLLAACAFPGEDRRAVINYETVAAQIRNIAQGGHIDLCEGLAERICAACLLDPKVERVRVWVEKLDVFADTDGVGAFLERARSL